MHVKNIKNMKFHCEIFKIYIKKKKKDIPVSNLDKNFVRDKK